MIFFLGYFIIIFFGRLVNMVLSVCSSFLMDKIVVNEEIDLYLNCLD
jgi:ABC-type bacteriocin/lantibiotic exporter with double-glycine peptidase domain